ncbi:hypothetical protein C8R47DRAFT_559443 [Mycena vitilis]|nr:hypothetical protein C8R47DRAFT_559443 [Mycena vitilis]
MTDRRSTHRTSVWALGNDLLQASGLLLNHGSLKMSARGIESLRVCPVYEAAIGPKKLSTWQSTTPLLPYKMTASSGSTEWPSFRGLKSSNTPAARGLEMTDDPAICREDAAWILSGGRPFLGGIHVLHLLDRLLRNRHSGSFKAVFDTIKRSRRLHVSGFVHAFLWWLTFKDVYIIYPISMYHLTTRDIHIHLYLAQY